MGYLKGAGAGRNGKNFATLAQYFATGKAHGGKNHYGRGREPGVEGAGGRKFRPPCPPHFIDYFKRLANERFHSF